MKYHKNWDLTTIPDDAWMSEHGRRMVARRKEHKGGRPAKLTPCEWCGKEFGVREMVKHRPLCPKRKD